MSITSPFELVDILHFNQVNADAWTATVRQLLGKSSLTAVS